MAHTWTKAQIQFLSLNVHRMTDEQIAYTMWRLFKVKVSQRAVCHKRRDLGVKKAQGRSYCKIVERRPGGGMSMYIKGSDGGQDAKSL